MEFIENVTAGLEKLAEENFDLKVSYFGNAEKQNAIIKANKIAAAAAIKTKDLKSNTE